ncbi:hypothetical protein GCM10008019_32580 [Deinococcus soli (ex Cha et al. 2016)]|nr:hypothetical protein GCM10008019_32580 [Deinococcus soli (ex Cha et al. 2016)]
MHPGDVPQYAADLDLLHSHIRGASGAAVIGPPAVGMTALLRDVARLRPYPAERPSIPTGDLSCTQET